MWKALIFGSSVGSKTENTQNQILLRQKNAPQGGESAQPYFTKNIWREIQKVGVPSFYRCTMSSSQVSFDSMLDF